ncbi:MAG TPA: hypothetical protein VGE60_00805 [Telluria sp.]
MRLQVQDSGTWRNVVTFTNHELPAVMAAASQLLRALNQPATSMRIAEGDTPIDSCQPPACAWSSQPAAQPTAIDADLLSRLLDDHERMYPHHADLCDLCKDTRTAIARAKETQT